MQTTARVLSDISRNLPIFSLAHFHPPILPLCPFLSKNQRACRYVSLALFRICLSPHSTHFCIFPHAKQVECGCIHIFFKRSTHTCPYPFHSTHTCPPVKCVNTTLFSHSTHTWYGQTRIATIVAQVGFRRELPLRVCIAQSGALRNKLCAIASLRSQRQYVFIPSERFPHLLLQAYTIGVAIQRKSRMFPYGFSYFT